MNKETSKIIQTGSHVSIHYTLSIEENRVVDSTAQDTPLSFVIGDGTFPSPVEQLFTGMKAGDRKMKSISPDNGWGYPDPKNIQTLPLSDFPDTSVLAIGNVIEFSLPNSTNIPGTIMDIKDECVEIDFNPPFAGRTVNFEVTIVLVSAPS